MSPYSLWKVCRLSRVCAALALCLGASISASAKPPEAPNFNLLDLSGRNRELHRVETRAVVLFFTGNGCPIARQSISKLKKLQNRFSKDVTFWVVNTYANDSLSDSRKEYEDFHIRPLTYLRDPEQGLALALGIERTAEVVAVNTSDWSVFYHGAIDDQLSEGAQRSEPQQNLLATALAEFIADKPVTLAQSKSHGCRITYAVEGKARTDFSYARDIVPILQKHCVQCHREDGIAPWNMDGYGRVKNNARMFEEVLLTKQMPPWHADPEYGHWGNDSSLTTTERQQLLAWISDGAARGEGEDPLTKPLAPLLEWPLGKPDFVISLPKPEHIPANGVLDYRHISVSLPMTNDIWLAGLDVKPGNRRVVHHVIARAKTSDGPDDGSGHGVMLTGWAPGSSHLKFPAGTGKHVPAGAKIDLELHYTTIGTEQTDQTQIACYLLPDKPARELTTRAALQLELNVPPDADESRDSAIYGFEQPATIYALAPHMHLRGSWMRFELLLPDGKRETMLNVPRYDFNWQTSYQLAEPRRVPKGAWMLVTGGFDNSAKNPHNPNAKARLHFGQQSWDEMFIGFFEAADEPSTESAAAGGASSAPSSVTR
jgi:hypothetical protein